MKITQNQFIYSPTDLAHHMSCKHLTQLEKRALTSDLKRPHPYRSKSLEALMERGNEFEAAFLQQFKDEGKEVHEVSRDNPHAANDTLAAMKRGVDVVFQARLKTDSWGGWADFLVRVDEPSELGAWSYEVIDTKLAKTTKGATILQIGLYSTRVAEMQGKTPEFMRVIKPNGEDVYRFDDFAAYVRSAQARLKEALENEVDTYPEPCSHCDICRWWTHCNDQRREDDHLTFVAGMRKNQIVELADGGIETLENLATAETFEPKRGNRATYDKLRRQAALQRQSRNDNYKPLHELLHSDTADMEEGKGLFKLPAPSDFDVFLDFEGARMVEPNGFDYLLGYVHRGVYTALWATNEKEERKNFEQFIDFVTQLKQDYPAMHIYHFAPYETTALKRLMSKYASRENEVDSMLRSGSFIDLYSVLRASVLASVERYSLKDLEAHFGYTREMDLRAVSKPKSTFEHLLEINQADIAHAEDMEIIERYNEDDCRALIPLQNWLEKMRREVGVDSRPPQAPGEAPDNINDHQERIKPIFDALMEDVPALLSDRTNVQQAHYILAHFLDWYRREEKSFYWEKFRLQAAELDELLEERKAVTYLHHLNESYAVQNSRVDTYRFPLQEIDIKPKDQLKNQNGEGVGSVHLLDRENNILHIKKGARLQQREHPAAVISLKHVGKQVKESSIIEFATWVTKNGIESEEEPYRAGRKLLLGQFPDCRQTEQDDKIVTAYEILKNMNGDVLAIQGPPGTGKSFTAGHLILKLLLDGKKVGVTALSHKVITNLVSKVYDLAQAQNANVKIVQLTSNDCNWTRAEKNEDMFNAVAEGTLLAGTGFLWSRAEFRQKLDYIFVDEAGQLSLIDTIALSHATKNLVLLGDPNQLQQPIQGVHPEGTELSALEFVLAGEKTLSTSKGIFLDKTWRMHPDINGIVSELFYQSRLEAMPQLEQQSIDGSESFNKKLALVESRHEGNVNSSQEEIETIEKVIGKLTTAGVTYTNDAGVKKQVERGDIMILSPYNAQVSLLQERFPELQIGTVDKFQGQEAPIVIYSMASSSAEDAPRGMDFLYNPNRFNVAISRARALFILVASPAIFDAEGKHPKQLKLANAFCRYKELAEQIPASSL